MARLIVNAVTKQFRDGTYALRDVCVTVEDGEFLTIVGPSGCGKSTLLRIIAGLETPTAGSVTIGERNVDDLPPGRRDVAMVVQGGANFPQLTVRQNLGVGLRIRRTPRAEVAQRVAAVAATLGLEPLLDRRPAELSGGENQRVAIGRSMLRDPALLLMDEPLSNLDAALRVEMRREIARLQRRLGTTMLFVTHDQSEALTLGHRVAVMRSGVIEQIDRPQDLFARPATPFVASFVGTPPMNLIRVPITGGSALLGDRRLPLPPNLRRAATRVIVGVRPGDLQLDHAGSTDRVALSVRVELVEHLGEDVNVTAAIDGSDQTIVFRVGHADAMVLGAAVIVSGAISDLHWFPAD